MPFMTAATVRNLPKYLTLDRAAFRDRDAIKQRTKLEGQKKLIANMSLDIRKFYDSLPAADRTNRAAVNKGTSKIIQQYQNDPNFSAEAVPISKTMEKAATTKIVIIFLNMCLPSIVWC